MPLRKDAAIPAGAELRTDERTRVALEMTGGTRLVLDHHTTLAFDQHGLRMTAGRVVADLGARLAITTPAGSIDGDAAKLAITATAETTSVQVVRGRVILTSGTATADVRAGEEGTAERGAVVTSGGSGRVTVAPAPQLAHDVAWAELTEVIGGAPKPDEVTSGLGALRAYKPGEKRDRDWNLALARHDVKVRIVGPIARTEITETFRNDSDTQLEGVYQFPLPADAQIDGLALDVKDAPGGFLDGAFLDKERGAKIWKGVIDKAAPKPLQLATSDMIWVPGTWRDPALLDWKRGGRFELKIFPIPSKGARTIKIAYTQVVTPRGPWRQYIYPLPHSADGSTVADNFTVDVEVRGAQPGQVHAAGYPLAADPARGDVNDVNALTLTAGGFVPRGDLVVDYRATDGDAELRAWTFAGGAAIAPDERLARTAHVGIDPKVVAAQRAIAADLRPTAVVALHPK
ncbi:MAG: VIT domain-containing protein, partial [Proteobacteria bacterium]|nr:VIT domain-containing protein [Pseudomonadota bacterium]